MKKKVFGRQLSRSKPAREALLASLAKSLILNGKIETTRAKAKAVTPDVEKMVTFAKKGTILGRRKVLAMLDNNRKATDVLFTNVVKALEGKTSGFTRAISLPRRHGDNAEMLRLEWSEKVDYKVKEKVEKKEIKKEEKKEEKKEVKETIKKEVKTKKI